MMIDFPSLLQQDDHWQLFDEEAIEARRDLQTEDRGRLFRVGLSPVTSDIGRSNGVNSTQFPITWCQLNSLIRFHVSTQLSIGCIPGLIMLLSYFFPVALSRSDSSPQGITFLLTGLNYHAKAPSSSPPLPDLLSTMIVKMGGKVADVFPNEMQKRLASSSQAHGGGEMYLN